jgi:hypothetical protein
MADPKGGKPTAVVDGAGVHPKNAISMAMEDLSEEDLKEIERELETEMAEIWRKKLACFQKTCNGVIKKAVTMAASASKVNAQLSPEDLVDVSVASKYGVDLTQFTRIMVEDMRNTFDTLK